MTQGEQVGPSLDQAHKEAEGRGAEDESTDQLTGEELIEAGGEIAADLALKPETPRPKTAAEIANEVAERHRQNSGSGNNDAALFPDRYSPQGAAGGNWWEI